MPDIPPNAIKLNLAQHVFLRRIDQRIIVPGKTQFEVEASEVEYSCPICQHIQAAPPLEDTDYECPKCKWHYKVYGDMLVLWDPRMLGRKIEAKPPGWKPREIVDDPGYADLARASALKEEENRKWREAQARGEVYGQTPQIVVPADVSGHSSTSSLRSASSSSLERENE